MEEGCRLGSKFRAGRRVGSYVDVTRGKYPTIGITSCQYGTTNFLIGVIKEVPSGTGQVPATVRAAVKNVSRLLNRSAARWRSLRGRRPDRPARRRATGIAG